MRSPSPTSESLSPFTKIGTWRARYNNIIIAGIAATIIGGFVSIIVIPIIWCIAVPEMLATAKINRKRQNAKQADDQKASQETAVQIPQ